MKAFHYTEVPAQPVEGLEGVTIRWVMAENVSAPHFATRVIEVQPGAATEQHRHDWEHEVFVLAGEGVARHANAEYPVRAGSCVYVAPNEVHNFANTGDSVLRIICIVPFPPQTD